MDCKNKLKPSLQHHALFTIAIVDEGSTCKLVTEFAVYLYHARFKENSDYFVVGSEHLASNKIDLKFCHLSVSSREKFSQDGEQLTIKSMFSKPKNSISMTLLNKKQIMPLLLYYSSLDHIFQLPKITLPVTGVLTINKNDALWNDMKDHLHDMIVFSQTTPDASFQKIASCLDNLKELSGTKGYRDISGYSFVIPENDVKAESDILINRCPTDYGFAGKFLYYNFKRGSPTPGQSNDC